MRTREARASARRLAKLVESAPREKWHFDEERESECAPLLARLYLGTVFSLSPSGKYYQPHACSNVAACYRCKGKGCDNCGGLGSREAHLDEVWRETLEKELARMHCRLECGEGSATDLFAVLDLENYPTEAIDGD